MPLDPGDIELVFERCAKLLDRPDDELAERVSADRRFALAVYQVGLENDILHVAGSSRPLDLEGR